MTEDEAASELGVSVESVRELVGSGHLELSEESVNAFRQRRAQARRRKIILWAAIFEDE